MEELKEKLNDKQKELIQKYTYFLLAVSGACIGFALQRTNDVAWGLHLIPLGISILLWGVSFYFGCRHIHHIRSANWISIAAARLFQTYKSDSAIRIEEKEEVEKFEDEFISKAETASSLQFYLLIAGVLFFVVWHVLSIYIHSNPYSAFSRFLISLPSQQLQY